MDTDPQSDHLGGRHQTFEDSQVSVKTGLRTPLVAPITRGSVPSSLQLGTRPPRSPTSMGRPTFLPWRQRLAPSWGGMSWQPQGKVAISCIHGDTATYPTLKTYVSIGQTQRHLTVGVVERLPHPVILGRDWPSIGNYSKRQSRPHT
ncbi:UNVERIFIED_CONTAM: hypothetical protein FKN15_028787 [Acipenser sinensis]